MNRIFPVLIASILLSACATTDTSNKSDDIVFTGFSSSADGTMTQKMRGFVCPANINDLALKKAELFQSDGSDAFCNYNDSQSEIFTVYLSEFPNESLEQYYQSSFYSTNLVMEEQAMTYDEELSSTCRAPSLAESLMSQLILTMAEDKEGDKEIVLEPIPSAVFTGPGNKLSILTVHETDEHEFLKYRFSLSGSTKEDTEVACEFLNEQAKFHKKYINEAKGIEPEPDLANLLELLGDSDVQEE